MRIDISLGSIVYSPSQQSEVQVHNDFWEIVKNCKRKWLMRQVSGPICKFLHWQNSNFLGSPSSFWDFQFNEFSLQHLKQKLFRYKYTNDQLLTKAESGPFKVNQKWPFSGFKYIFWGFSKSGWVTVEPEFWKAGFENSLLLLSIEMAEK